MQIRTYAVLVVARRHANAPRLALQCGVSLVYAARSRRRLWSWLQGMRWRSSRRRTGTTIG